MELHLLIGALGPVVVLVVCAVVVSRIRIARPCEFLVISGSGDRRVVEPGEWAFQWPLVEKTDQIDLRIMQVDLRVDGAFSQGGIPVNLRAVATVGIDHRVHRDNAIDRFLGRSSAEIRRVASQTLEAVLREVAAELSPEQILRDRLEFTRQVTLATEGDFNELGLRIETLKICHVGDSRGYFDSLEREKTGEQDDDDRNQPTDQPDESKDSWETVW